MLQSAQSRRILALMGISYWVDKACQPHVLPKMQERFDGFNHVHNNHADNPRIQHLLPKEAPKTPNPITPPSPAHQTSVPVMVSAPKTTAPSAIPKITTPKTADITPPHLPPKTHPTHDVAQVAMPPEPPDTPSTAPVADVRFHLQGVRFGRWVLAVDVLGLDDEMMSVWQSLQQALIKHANQHSISHHSHEAHYPMVNADNDYKEHRHLMPANAVFWGFLFGLGVGVDTECQLAYLTALPDGLSEFDTCVKHLPSLDELIKQPTLKKQLWANITQNP